LCQSSCLYFRRSGSFWEAWKSCFMTRRRKRRGIDRITSWTGGDPGSFSRAAFKLERYFSTCWRSLLNFGLGFLNELAFLGRFGSFLPENRCFGEGLSWRSWKASSSLRNSCGVAPISARYWVCSWERSPIGQD